jgi:hypothetical protein
MRCRVVARRRASPSCGGSAATPGREGDLRERDRRARRPRPSNAGAHLTARAPHDERTAGAYGATTKSLREFTEPPAQRRDHFLQDGVDRGGLELAQAGYHRASVWKAAVALARVATQNAQPQRAVEVLEAHLADGWDTAEIHWVLGDAWARLGQQDAADAAQRAALARNPASAAMYATVGK